MVTEKLSEKVKLQNSKPIEHQNGTVNYEKKAKQRIVNERVKKQDILLREIKMTSSKEFTLT